MYYWGAFSWDLIVKSASWFSIYDITITDSPYLCWCVCVWLLRLLPQNPRVIGGLERTMRDKKRWHVCIFVIREETGTDVTGSQTGCCVCITQWKHCGDPEAKEQSPSMCLWLLECERACMSFCRCDDGGESGIRAKHEGLQLRDWLLWNHLRFTWARPENTLIQPFFFKCTYNNMRWGCLGRQANRMCARERSHPDFSAECWLLLIRGCWLSQNFC